MDSDGREVAFSQKLVQLGSSLGTLDEDDDLVEFKRIKEVIEFSVLLAFVKSDSVLLETVKSELGLIVDVEFHGVSHEFSADWSDFL